MQYKLKANQQFRLRLNMWDKIEQSSPLLEDYNKLANELKIQWITNENISDRTNQKWIECIVKEDNTPIFTLTESKDLKKSSDLKWSTDINANEQYEYFITNSVNMSPNEFRHKLLTDIYMHEESNQGSIFTDPEVTESAFDNENTPPTPAPEPEPEPEPIDEVNLTINLEDLDISTKDLLSTHLHLSNFTKPFIRISKITGKIKQYKTMKEGTIFIKSSKVLTETTNLITNLALYRWNLRNKDGSITAFYPQTENAIEDPKVLLYNETWDYWDKENFDEIYSAHLRIKPTLVPKPLTFNQRIKQALILGHNVKLEGTAGCGKTTLSRQMAKELNLDIYKITLTRQTTMKDLVGYYNPILGKEVSSPIIEAYTKGGLLFIDEMDAGDPNTLIIVNSVCDRELAHHTTGKLIECHPDFKIISAINLTDELHHYVGKNKLDKSTNSRYKNFKLDTWQDRFTPNVISVYNKVNDFAVQLGKEAYWCDIRGLDRFVLDVPVLDIKVALQDLTAGLNLPKEQLYILISLYNEV